MNILSYVLFYNAAFNADFYYFFNIAIIIIIIIIIDDDSGGVGRSNRSVFCPLACVDKCVCLDVLEFWPIKRGGGSVFYCLFICCFLCLQTVNSIFLVWVPRVLFLSGRR